MIELVVVVAIMMILAVLVVPNIFSSKRLYQSETQSLMIMDLLREASQQAMNQRRTFRVEIDLTDNALLLIDERNSDPDEMVKSIPLASPSDIRLDSAPDGVDGPTPPDYNDITFINDETGHDRNGTSVSGHNVWAARFQRDGTVVNNAGNPISATIYVWPPAAPESAEPRAATEVRAITMFGGSGAVRYWKYDGSTFLPY